MYNFDVIIVKYVLQAYSIDHWMEAGAPRDKLIMGMPLYGQSFTLSSSSNHGLNAPAPSPGSQGPFTRQAGFLAYYEICYNIKTDGWTVVEPNEQMGPYAYKDKQWVSYDDKATIRKKVIFEFNCCALQQNIIKFLPINLQHWYFINCYLFKV